MPLYLDVQHLDGPVTTDDAPDAEAANTAHREAHGLVADEIHEVSKGV